MTGDPRGTPPPDLRAVEARLQATIHRALVVDCSECAGISQDVRALLAHCRALRAEYNDIGSYIGHQAGCTFENAPGDAGDTCTCGLAEMKARVRAVLAQATDE